MKQPDATSNEHRANLYEAAMKELTRHIGRADDGTFTLGPEAGAHIDPAIFEDLRQSLEVTNTMFRRGQISREQLDESYNRYVGTIPSQP